MLSRPPSGPGFPEFPRHTCVSSQDPPCPPPSLAGWSHPHTLLLKPKKWPDVTEGSTPAHCGYRNAPSSNPAPLHPRGVSPTGSDRSQGSSKAVPD